MLLLGKKSPFRYRRVGLLNCAPHGQPVSGHTMRWWFCVSFLLLFTLFSWAETGQKGKRKFKKRVVIDFQDELLEGNVANPSIFHLFHKKQMDYGRLVKFRKNFLPEMRRTAREL